MSLQVRPARWGDLSEVHAAYRAQPQETRRLYHPFPFGSLRLSLFLRVLWVAGHTGPRRVRRWPTSVAMLFVARAPPEGDLAGFGTLRFRSGADRSIVARTGVFVVPGHRRSGVGRELKTVMMARGQALGALRVEAFLSASNVASAGLNRALGYHLRASGPGDPSESRGLLIAEADLGAAHTGRTGTVGTGLEAGVGAEPAQ